MEYEITLFHKKQSLIALPMESNTTIQDLINFLVEAYPEKFKELDQSKIFIQSRALKIYLNPKLNLEQILGQKKDDIFDIEINENKQHQVSQSIYGGYPVQQQINQTQNSQQNSDQKFGYPIQSQNQQYSITFKYNNNQSTYELDGETTLEDMFQYIEQEFNIQEQVQFQWNQINLSEYHKQTKLQALKLNQQSQIFITPAQNFLQTQIYSNTNQQPLQQIQQPYQQQQPQQPQQLQQPQQSQMIKLQFQIEDGHIRKNCTLNCYTSQQLYELKIGVLQFIGINNMEVADVDFYFGQVVMVGRKLNKTLMELNIVQDSTIRVKIRWTGG